MAHCCCSFSKGNAGYAALILPQRTALNSFNPLRCPSFRSLFHLSMELLPHDTFALRGRTRYVFIKRHHIR